MANNIISKIGLLKNDERKPTTTKTFMSPRIRNYNDLQCYSEKQN